MWISSLVWITCDINGITRWSTIQILAFRPELNVHYLIIPFSDPAGHLTFQITLSPPRDALVTEDLLRANGDIGFRVGGLLHSAFPVSEPVLVQHPITAEQLAVSPPKLTSSLSDTDTAASQSYI